MLDNRQYSPFGTSGFSLDDIHRWGNPIFYVNAFPGAGKTYAALGFAESLLRNPDPDMDCVLVYAAPTILLMEQFLNDLLDRDPRYEKKIRVVRARSSGNDDTSTAEQARRNLKHRKAIRRLNDQIPDRYVTEQLQAYLAGEQAHELATDRIQAVPSGTVLVTSHEAIVRAPKHLRGAARVSLIFDEARQCLCGEYEVSDVPADLVTWMFSEKDSEGNSLLLNEGDVIFPSGVSSKVSSYTRWRWGRRRNKKGTASYAISPEILAKKWKSQTGRQPSGKRVQELYDFLLDIRNDRLDVYVNTSSISKETQTLTINALYSPSRLFYGYGKVLILSAFFEQSQMYRLLRYKEKLGRVDKGPNKGQYLKTMDPLDRVRLVEVTEEVTDAKRRRHIMTRRLKLAYITYIFDEKYSKMAADRRKRSPTRGRLSFSAEQRNRGIVTDLVPASVADKLNDAYGKLFAQVRGEVTAELERQGKRSRVTKLMTYQMAMGLPKGSRLRALIESRVKPSKHTPVQYMSLMACNLKELWCNQHRIVTDKPLLIGLNESSENISMSGRTKRRGGREWDKQGLEALLNSERIRAVNARLMVQGLNSFKDYPAAAYLASLKLTSQQTSLYEQLIPDYNCRLDRTLDSCIQFLFRINVRKSSSKDRALFIVTDRVLAEAIGTLLGDYLTVVPPENLDCNWKYKTILCYQPKQDTAAAKAYAKAYNATPARKHAVAKYQGKLGPRYGSLSTKLSRLNSKLRTNIDLKTRRALELEIVALKKERTSLLEESRQNLMR